MTNRHRLEGLPHLRSMSWQLARVAGGALLGLSLTSLAGCSVPKADGLAPTAIDQALTPAHLPWPTSLAEAHLFTDGDSTSPSPELTPYQVKVPLWSDGAAKDRYIYLPPGTAVAVKEDPASQKLTFDFPVGTTLVKHFRSPPPEDVPVETRVITLKDNGQWVFATYVWTDGGSADLNSRPRKVTRGGLEHRIPSEKECVLCHNSKTSPILGFTPEQLNHTKLASGHNQLDDLTMAHILPLRDDGRLEAESLPDPSDQRLPIATRARAYMHVNCGTCHQPQGPDIANRMDLRLGAIDTKLISEGKVVPGQPSQSIMIDKLTSSVNRMPFLSLRPDPEALDLLPRYVESLTP